MKFLSLATSIIMMVIVAIVAAVLISWNQTRPTQAPGEIVDTPLSKRIERMPEYEAAMEKFGYKAWGYKWYGGMIDVEMRVGPGDKLPITFDGKQTLSALQNLGSSLNKPPFTQDNLNGSVMISLGPTPDDNHTNDIPCQVVIVVESPGGLSENRRYNLLVEYAASMSVGESGVSVASKWKEAVVSNGIASRGSDLESGYDLLKLRWLPPTPPTTQGQTLPESGREGGI